MLFIRVDKLIYIITYIRDLVTGVDRYHLHLALYQRISLKNILHTRYMGPMFRRTSRYTIELKKKTKNNNKVSNILTDNTYMIYMV